MTNILLTVCIPTYNRAALLTDALRSVISQVDEGMVTKVEIIVSDNDSSDMTEQTVHTLFALYPNVHLKYVRQPRNLGADANIYSVMQQSQGEFLWVLSDDDILLPGALQRILNEIQSNPDADTFYLNSGSFITDWQTLRVLMLKTGEDCTLTDPNACLTLIGAGLTFLSAIALRRSLIQNQDYTLRIGSNMIQTYVFVDALAASRQIRVIMQPTVGIRENNSGGYSYYEVFVTNYLDALSYAGQHGYTEGAVRTARWYHLRYCLFPYVRAEKMTGHSSDADLREGARRMLKAYGPNPFLLFVILPFLLLPKTLLCAARAVAGRGRK